MGDVLVALGANLGPRRQSLERAAEAIAQLPGTVQFRLSSLHETQPSGGPGAQPAYLNAVCRFRSSQAPTEILAELQEIEGRLGRVRGVRWGPREIDLDLLLVGQHEVVSTELVLPHPRLSFRRFVLAPAVEVAPEWILPDSGLPLAELLRWLDDSPCGIALASRRPEQAAEFAALASTLTAAWRTAPPVDLAWRCLFSRSPAELVPAPRLIVAVGDPAEQNALLAGWRGPRLRLPETTPLDRLVEEISAARVAME